jgi:hypothetical protein
MTVEAGQEDRTPLRERVTQRCVANCPSAGSRVRSKARSNSRLRNMAWMLSRRISVTLTG